MKSAATLLFAGAAAAYEYGAAPVSSSSHAGYTTIHPGHHHAPVTVTAQYQPVPSYDASASKFNDYLFVSTVVTDADGKHCTVTKTEQPVTVYHSKSTITHTTTEYVHATPTGGYAWNKNGTAAIPKTRTWEELYEVIGKVPYKNIGPSGLPGYPGSGLCGEKCWGKEGIKYQPVDVEEYKNGKWATYTVTYTYGAPTPKATTYDKPGTYTVSSYDVTIHKTTTVPAEATYTAPAGKTVTYGGSVTEVTKPCTITAHYGAYETEGAKTKTVIKTTTIYADKPGKYTIVKPTVTKYEHETTCPYPTAKVYPPGVYHHKPETVTITKSHQAYTCSYDSTSTYATPTSSSHPVYSVPSDGYATATPSSTKPHGPDPSSDHEEPAESYGTASAGYVKRGGMLERRKADKVEKKLAPAAKRVILV